MGRFGAKGKKLCVNNKDDIVSSEKENVTAQKRRGRPQKLLKNEINEDEAPKKEDEDSEDTTGVPNKDVKAANGKRRKTNAQVEKVDSVEECNGNETKSSTEEESKNSNGLRHYRNRRKSKPRRAAEAVVECN